MAICHFAAWRPIPENETEPRVAKRIMIFHSAAIKTSSLYDYFKREDVKVESHFFVKWDGSVEQYIDTDRQADCNYKANDFAISVETEDDGDPNNKKWSPEQVKSMVRLARWGRDVHGIPQALCPKWDGSGIGFHTMFGAPSNWTPVAKSCPGAIRKVQFKDEFMPLVLKADPPPKPAPLDVGRRLYFEGNDPSKRGYILDAWGGVHALNGAKPIANNPYWPGTNLAAALAVKDWDGPEAYVLDRWGGVHAVGTAKPLVWPTRSDGSSTKPYWAGWEIANDLIVSPDGKVVMLDGFGGQHVAGGAVADSEAPYWG